MLQLLMHLYLVDMFDLYMVLKSSASFQLHSQSFSITQACVQLGCEMADIINQLVVAPACLMV